MSKRDTMAQGGFIGLSTPYGERWIRADAIVEIGEVSNEELRRDVNSLVRLQGDTDAIEAREKPEKVVEGIRKQIPG